MLQNAYVRDSQNVTFRFASWLTKRHFHQTMTIGVEIWLNLKEVASVGQVSNTNTFPTSVLFHSNGIWIVLSAIKWKMSFEIRSSKDLVVNHKMTR